MPDEADADRQLALRRAELEREFEGKLRDLKDQHKRRMDALKREEEEFEALRRTRTKELADREERLRQNERKAMETTLKVQTVRSEVESRKDRLERLDEHERKAAADVADATARADQATGQLKGVRKSMLNLAAALFVGGLLLFLAASRLDDRLLLIPAAMLVGAALGTLSIRGKARPPSAP